MAGAIDLLAGLARLWNVAQGDTGQSGVCARLLLSLYNGPRFPFAVTELRRLDADLLRAAIDVLAADGRRDLAGEGPEVLNKAYGRQDFGHRLEHMAFEWGCKGASRKAALPAAGRAPMLVKPPERPATPPAPVDRAMQLQGATWTGA